MALINLDRVGKLYPRGTRPALENINLSISRGEFIFLVGSSGSGKTTLLSLLLREEEATDGEIRVAGNDLRRISHRQVPQYRRQIGFIFQDYKLLNNKTVWQNVAFALEVVGTNRSTIRRLVSNALQTVGLTGKESNYPHELSGGEAQRVAIARAYVNHPQILLADEPTGNLDPTTSLGIMEVLDAINRAGTTIVMATHNEEIVNSMRKRVIELHNGNIVRDEEHGSYDSALFFPDEEVEAKAQEVLQSTALLQPDGSNVLQEASEGILEESAHHDLELAANQQIDDEESSKQEVSHQMLGNERSADQVATVGQVNPSDERSSSDQMIAAVRENDSEILVEESSTENVEEEGLARLAKSLHQGRKGRYGDVFRPFEETMTWGEGLPLPPPPPPSVPQASTGSNGSLTVETSQLSADFNSSTVSQDGVEDGLPDDMQDQEVSL